MQRAHRRQVRYVRHAKPLTRNSTQYRSAAFSSTLLGIRYQHDYRLVLLAVVICALTSWTAWYLDAMSSKSSGLSRWAWILQTAVATGSGIWATHFIAMLAFKSTLPTT